MKDAVSLFGISQEEESLAPPADDPAEEGAAPEKPADAKSQAAKSDTLAVPTTPMPGPNEVSIWHIALLTKWARHTIIHCLLLETMFFVTIQTCDID